MVEQEITCPITPPKPRVSSFVVVSKPDWKLRLCLDPKDLNKAVQREYYPLPTIEDVATRLHDAKVFTKLDIENLLLARLTGRRLVIPHGIQYTIWEVPVAAHALRKPFGAESFPKRYARTDRRNAKF